MLSKSNKETKRKNYNLQAEKNEFEEWESEGMNKK